MVLGFATCYWLHVTLKRPSAGASCNHLWAGPALLRAASNSTRLRVLMINWPEKCLKLSTFHLCEVSATLQPDISHFESATFEKVSNQDNSRSFIMCHYSDLWNSPSTTSNFDLKCQMCCAVKHAGPTLFISSVPLLNCMLTYNSKSLMMFHYTCQRLSNRNFDLNVFGK